MDTSRISFGEMVAAASAAALFIFMFFPWFGVEVSSGPIEVSESFNAWESLSFIDILLFLVILVAIGVAVARATGNMPRDLPAPAGTIVMAAGALAVLLILFRILSVPDGDIPAAVEDSFDVGRKIGVFLGLIAAAGIAYGGFLAKDERGEGPVTGGRGPTGTSTTVAGTGAGASSTPAPPEPTAPPSTPPADPPASGGTPPSGGTPQP